MFTNLLILINFVLISSGKTKFSMASCAHITQSIYAYFCLNTLFLLHLIRKPRRRDIRGKLCLFIYLEILRKLYFDIAHLSDIAAIYFKTVSSHTIVFIFCMVVKC